MVLCSEILRVFTDFVNCCAWRMFIDCLCCTVPEEGKLIKYSHQMSPPLKRNFEFLLSFPKVLTIFSRPVITALLFKWGKNFHQNLMISLKFCLLL